MWEFPNAFNPVTLLTLEADPFIAEARHALERPLEAIDCKGVDVSTSVAEGPAAEHLVKPERYRT